LSHPLLSAPDIGTLLLLPIDLPVQALKLMRQMVVGSSCACLRSEQQQLAAVNKLTCMDAAGRAALVAAGVMPVLVQLVMRGSREMELAALTALLELAADHGSATQQPSSHSSQLAAAAGGVKAAASSLPVFKAPAHERVTYSAAQWLTQVLVTSSSSTVQAQTLAVIVALTAGSPACSAASVEAGLVGRLVELLQDSRAEAVLSQAAAALANLCNGDAAAISAVKSEPDVLACLVSLLQDTARDEQDSAGVQQAAAAALRNLAADDPSISAAIVQRQGSPALVRLLASSRPAVQLQAAAALRHMVLSSQAIQTAVAQEPGCVAGLVKMLSDSNEQVQAQAGLTLGCLALRSHDNQDTIAEACAIPALLQLLHSPSSSSTESQEAAAYALVMLAAGNSSIEERIKQECPVDNLLQQVVSSSDVHVAPALLLLALARDSPGVGSEIAGAQGGIASLVRLLASSNDAVQVGAAIVLGCLAEMPDSQGLEYRAAIAAEKSSITLLVQQLHSSSWATQQVAASALRHLAAGSTEMQASIAAVEECVPALVRLLQDGSTTGMASSDAAQNGLHERQYEAAMAIATMAADSTELQSQLAADTGEYGCVVGLVRMLHSSNDDVRVSAASALAVVAGDHRSDALVAAGAISPLVQMLLPQQSTAAGDSANVQFAAAAALSFMTEGSASSAMAIAAAGAIPILVQLLAADQQKLASVAAGILDNLAAADRSLAATVAAERSIKYAAHRQSMSAVH
jgi:hypothetical protein